MHQIDTFRAKVKNRMKLYKFFDYVIFLILAGNVCDINGTHLTDYTQ